MTVVQAHKGPGENVCMSPLDAFVPARARMVDTQIVRRGIRDVRVLDAMRTVPRHRFVPEELAAKAYDDHPLPIGHGQTISQPYIVAYMIEQLRLEPDSRVLEVGAGCGYQAAVLAHLVSQVYAVEIVPALAALATTTLESLEVRNVFVDARDGRDGWPEHAPFDAVIVAAATRNVPPALLTQLAPGGRLLLPLGDEGFQTLHLIEKQGASVIDHALIDVRFVPLITGHKSA